MSEQEHDMQVGDFIAGEFVTRSSASNSTTDFENVYHIRYICRGRKQRKGQRWNGITTIIVIKQ